MTATSYPNVDTALAHRIRAVADVLLKVPEVVGGPSETDWHDVGDLLYDVVLDVHENLTPDRIWLLYTAVSTVMPGAEDVREAMRMFELSTVDESMHWLLETCLNAALDHGHPMLELSIVQDAVVVEVDFSARFDLHTGIQRVARELLPRWERDHEIVPVAWGPRQGVLRTLDDAEVERILRWHGGAGQARDTEPEQSERLAKEPQWSLVVPWNCVVVLAEVPAREVCDRLAALGEYSCNRLVALGYDCIPVVSADLVPPVEPNRFVRYLTVVKYMKRIAGISVSATDEFAGFAHALSAQGLAGPKVFECRLPNAAIGGSATGREASPSVSDPTILCVGSFEPRKNQVAVVYAAETLWREGLRFRLHLIGGGGAGTGLTTLIKRLARRGRPVVVSRAVSDADLELAFRTARFTVFSSLHEGYGLPVAESLSFGVPVVATRYGSIAEIVASGGALLVDPRSDDELTQAMRTLLTDDAVLEKLKAEIQGMTARSWDDYADDLWVNLVEPERAESAR